jgi:hypothetical protein
MGLFKKKEEKGEMPPELPELPKLPDFPKTDFSEKEPLHQLPSFPSSSFGEKFSQNAIKEAISGKKEDDGDFNADEDKIQMMHGSPKTLFTNEISMPEKHIPSIGIKEINEPSKKEMTKNTMEISKEKEPVFVRIDKFEEGLQTLEKAKKDITEIEKMLKQTKELKEKEEVELNNWEKSIQKIKKQIEEIYDEIFSKIE